VLTKIQKSDNVYAMKKISKILTVSAVIVAILTGLVASAVSPVEALGPQRREGNIIYRDLDVVRTMRTWRPVAAYDLKTLKRVRHYGPLREIRVSKLAYRNGGFFYIEAEAAKQGKFEGVYVNTVYRINDRKQAIFGSHVVPTRNGMPLTQHRTQQGTCTASRIWHEGMNNNMVAAIQRVELHMGRHLPINYAYRTNAEQRCIYNNRGSNSYPVAVPGTSDHEKGLAIDLEYSAAVDPGYERVLNQYGICRPIPASDPIHYEYCR
jgi:hypothetical protein